MYVEKMELASSKKPKLMTKSNDAYLALTITKDKILKNKGAKGDAIHRGIELVRK